MIGCGGSGQKSVRYIRDAVRRQLEHGGWTGDFPRSWQFIGLDTLNVQEAPGEIPVMPSSDYLSLSAGFTQYRPLENALLAQHPVQSAGYKELIGWRPLGDQVTVPLNDGAGQLRGVGRAAGIVSLTNVVRPKLQEAFTECAAGGPELQAVSETLGVPVPPGTTQTPQPIVVVLGSMAGGTGAGVMLDVLDLVRRTHQSGAYPVAVIFTPDIFGDPPTDAMAANGLAMMSELMSAYWDNELSGSELIPAVVPVNNRGPHATFLIGRKNLDGIDLESSINVYRAVGEAMASWVTTSGVQEAVWNFINVNWTNDSRINMGGYPFGQIYQPGVVSSFGSATLSIGRDRFRDFAQKLLMREMLEHLYEGHLRSAKRELGQDAENLTEEGKLTALVDKQQENFLRDCHLDERGKETNQITNRFVSTDLTKVELAQVKKEFGLPFGPQQWTGQTWHHNLLGQANIAKKSSSGRAVAGYEKEAIEWGTEMFERLLRVTSIYVGQYGLKMTGNLVRIVQVEVSQVSGEVHEEANEDRSAANAKLEEAKSALKNVGGGEIGFEAAPVQAAFDHMAKAIVSEWRAIRRERVAEAMENLSVQILAPLGTHIDQALAQVHEYVSGTNGKDSLVETWPEHQKGIPQGFRPSPLEFFLEGIDTWQGLIEDLMSDAMELALRNDDTSVPFQPSNSVDATRFLLNVGDFAADKNTRVPPIVWATTFGAPHPQWSPGGTPQIVIAITYEEILERVNHWMNRPATKMSRTLNEGLRDYLSPINEGQPVPNHKERLNKFRQKLGQAKIQSRPLIELDNPLNSVIHVANPQPEVSPLVGGFPFAVGTPAHDLVVELMGDDDKVSKFTDRETETVLISSFIKYPVHPMTVSSFTRPLGQVLQRIGPNAALLQGGFWLWRRTKLLEDFAPLPDEVRFAIIRGFAVARMLGYITADPAEPVTIVSENKLLQFPYPLLTDVSTDNLLAALIEGFSLCYGDVATRQLASFEAYERLFKLGEGRGHQYTLAQEALAFLHTGQLPLNPVDPRRADKARAATKEERCANLIEYLDDNIRRFKRLAERPFTGQEHRDKFGKVHPEDALTVELVTDFLDAYEEVKTAIETGGGGGGVT